MDINFLSGAALSLDKQLLYDAMKSGLVYLGFGRNTPEWGQSALFRISHLGALTWPGDIVGTDNDLSSPNEKFYDGNSSDFITTGVNPAGGDTIFIAAINKTQDPNVFGNFVFIDAEEIGDIVLEWINSGWAQVSGLTPGYIFNDVATLDYYIFNYNKDITTRAKISEYSLGKYLSSVAMPVRLGYGATQTVVDELVTAAGTMTRQVSLNGEVVIAGMNPSFDISGYDSQWWFLTNPDGTIVQNGLTLVGDVTEPEERILTFQYSTVTGTTAILKVTTATNVLNTLSVFKESFTINSATPVADNNPPSLKLGYLKDSYISRSLFDIQGIVQLVPGDIEFGRRVADSVDQADLESKGFTIITFTLQTDNPTTVKYAVTDSVGMTDPIGLAIANGCDSVYVTKSLDNSTPTSETYRQLFISYKPQDSAGSLCVASSYSGTQLWNPTTYEYNMGVLMYIANKIPIYRGAIVGTEDFQVIL